MYLCIHVSGTIPYRTYEPRTHANRLILFLSARTLECVTTKLMHALHQTSDYNMVREIMHYNCVGEINKEYILY